MARKVSTINRDVPPNRDPSLTGLRENVSQAASDDITSLFRYNEDELLRNIGLTQPYWGPASCRSAMPKTSGSRKILYGFVTRKLITGGNKVRAVVSMIAAPGEQMKALANGTVNGFGDCYCSLVYNGVAYPGVVVDSVDKEFNVVTVANKPIVGNNRWGRAPYGDILSFEFDLTAAGPGGTEIFIPDNSEVAISIMSEQQAHNDASQSLSGQYMVYSNTIKDKDFYCGVTALTEQQRADWQAVIDSGVKPSTMVGTSLYIGFGFDVHNVYTLTNRPTVGIIGDSKNHGPSIESTSIFDFDHDCYGANGEISNIFGMDYGISNCAYQTEQGTQLVNLSAKGSFDGRAKLIAMTSHGCHAMGYNDLTLDSDWTSELMIISKYQTNFDWVRNRCPFIKNWILATLSPSITSTDFVTSIDNEWILRALAPLRALNGVIRRGAIVGQTGYVDPAAAVAPRGYNDNLMLVDIPANARKINTGTGTITLTAAAGTEPDTTKLTHSGNLFKITDEASNFSIPGIGATGGVLRGTIIFETTGRVRLIIRGSEDKQTRIPSSYLNGGVTTLNVDFSVNPIYIGAEDLFSDAGNNAPPTVNNYIHYGNRGFRRMREFNRARGLTVL